MCDGLYKMEKLINKSYKKYDIFSRYELVPYYYNTYTKKYTYGSSSWLDDTTVYQNYKIEANDTLDSLSLRAYGTPIYYWIIASFNRILDPFEPLEVGSIIKIPSKTSIVFEEYSR